GLLTNGLDVARQERSSGNDSRPFRKRDPTGHRRTSGLSRTRSCLHSPALGLLVRLNSLGERDGVSIIVGQVAAVEEGRRWRLRVAPEESVPVVSLNSTLRNADLIKECR